MKITTYTFLSFSIIFILSSLASADQLPKRKAGLWKATSSQAGPQADSESCIDEATDAKLMEQSMGMAKNMCKKNEIKQDGASFVIDSECTLGASTITSSTRMEGDFNSKYTVTSKSTYSPPMMGMSEVSNIITATWIGPCKPDQKPGDVIMANGMKMNTLDMFNSKGTAEGFDPAKMQKMMEDLQKRQR